MSTNFSQLFIQSLCIFMEPTEILMTMVLQEEQLWNTNFHDSTFAFGFLKAKSITFNRFYHGSFYLLNCTFKYTCKFNYKKARWINKTLSYEESQVGGWFIKFFSIPSINQHHLIMIIM